MKSYIIKSYCHEREIIRFNGDEEQVGYAYDLVYFILVKMGIEIECRMIYCSAIIIWALIWLS